MSTDPRRSHLTSESLARGIARQIWKDCAERAGRNFAIAKITRRAGYHPPRNFRAWQKLRGRLIKQARKPHSNIGLLYDVKTTEGPYLLLVYLFAHDHDRLATLVLSLPSPRLSIFTEQWCETAHGPIITRHAIERLIQRARIQSTEELRALLWRFLGSYLDTIQDHEPEVIRDLGARDALILQDWIEPVEIMIEYRLRYSEDEDEIFLVTVIVDGVPIWEMLEDD